jgi:hypothetical protein
MTSIAWPPPRHGTRARPPGPCCRSWRQLGGAPVGARRCPDRSPGERSPAGPGVPGRGTLRPRPAPYGAHGSSPGAAALKTSSARPALQTHAGPAPGHQAAGRRAPGQRPRARIREAHPRGTRAPDGEPQANGHAHAYGKPTPGAPGRRTARSRARATRTQAGGWGERPIARGCRPVRTHRGASTGAPVAGEVEPQAVGCADACGATIGAPGCGASSPGAGGSADGPHAAATRGGPAGAPWREAGLVDWATGRLGDWASSGHQA